MTKELKLVDLDGTLTTPNIIAVLNEHPEQSPDVEAYIQAAAEFVSKEISELKQENVYKSIIKIIKENVIPKRAKKKLWAKFRNTQGKPEPICPPVDHFLMVQSAVLIYLKAIWKQQKDKENSVSRNIIKFIEANKYIGPLFDYSRKASISYEKIDSDAIDGLDEALEREDLIAILTNSSNKYAQDLLEPIFRERIIMGEAKPGKLGIIGDAKKYQNDPNWDIAGPRWGNSLDLTHFFNEEITLSLQRKALHDLVQKVMEECGAERVHMIGDIPELELFPISNFPEFKARISMRETESSAEESIIAVIRLCKASVSKKVSDLLVN
jgi:hypothetical protein